VKIKNQNPRSKKEITKGKITLTAYQIKTKTTPTLNKNRGVNNKDSPKAKKVLKILMANDYIPISIPHRHAKNSVYGGC